MDTDLVVFAVFEEVFAVKQETAAEMKKLDFIFFNWNPLHKKNRWGAAVARW
jgi:hypothetical protein